MQEMVKIAGFAAAACAMAAVAKEARAGLGMALALSAGVMLLAVAAARLSTAAGALQGMLETTGLPAQALTLVMKVLGVAYLTEFSMQVCRDMGQEGIAEKVCVCGRLALFSLTLPLLADLCALALSLTP